MSANKPLPLQDVTIIDLTRLLPGPVATQHLADMGAVVIKIEDTHAGDYARQFGLGDEQIARGMQSPFFTVINRGKRMEKLDLKHPQDHARLIELVRGADALIESFRPGVMDKLGLGYEVLKLVNPKLVYCAISGYGQTGPLRDAAGHDINYLATAGAFSALSTESGAPALPNLQIADLMGGAMMAAMSTLAAIIGARATGIGRFIDVSMTEGVLLHNLSQLYAHNLTGRSKPAGQDMLNGGLPCYGLYRCKDEQYLAVGALELKFWERVCDVLQKPEWKSMHQTYGLVPGSPEARKIKAQLSDLIAAQPLSYWVDQFKDVDACVTPVLSFEEALNHPQFSARGLTQTVKTQTDSSVYFSLTNSFGWCNNR
jgi:alpha-methylacyl-CoA racemase